MTKQSIDIIVIGGSSGCITPLIAIIESLPKDFMIPVVIVIHRMKNIQSNLTGIFSLTKNISEPEDKEPIEAGRIYLAPQNYHLLVEKEHVFSMDYSEPVHYSRPSIDVTFLSVAAVYKQNSMGILLSGSNKDGAEGIQQILLNGGRGIVQDPKTAEYPIMPNAAIQCTNKVEILTPENIIQNILNLS